MYTLVMLSPNRKCVYFKSGYSACLNVPNCEGQDETILYICGEFMKIVHISGDISSNYEWISTKFNMLAYLGETPPPPSPLL